jgi:hypothetical protein
VSDWEFQRRIGQRILFAFLVTFILSRVMVLLIMTRKVPDFYFYLGGTHVHHLNYGIFLLAGVGAYLLLRPMASRRWTSILYGIGLGFTFDEFGMWLHLGGSYWQRASWDAVGVIAATLGLFVYGPSVAQYRPRHWLGAAAVLMAVAGFLFGVFYSVRHAAEYFGPRLERIETKGPQ